VGVDVDDACHPSCGGSGQVVILLCVEHSARSPGLTEERAL
jgi:hypothetical protein